MPFRVIQPPSDQAEFTEVAKRIYTAGIALGIPLDPNPEGFMFSWVNGVRVVVEEVEGEIKGLALVAIGKRWTHNDTTASVLVVESNGDYDGLIEFIKQICTVFGSTELFIQSRAVLREGGVNKYTIIGHMLG